MNAQPANQTAGEVYKKNIGGVVAVFTGGRFRGSGVVVGNNEVVTNCHVVADGNPVEIRRAGGGESPPHNQFPARVVAASPRDLCLLKTEGLSASAVEFGPSDSVGIGDPVYAIGHPGGVYGTLSSGIASQSWPHPGGAGEWAGCVIQTTASISGGSSGGGLFDREGRLVGITSSSGDGESLHMALPAELAGHLRQRAGVEEKLHDELSAALENPSPEKFRELADRIVESFSDPVHASRARRYMGSHEALFGDKKAAARQVKFIRALADALAGEPRDLALVEAVHVQSDMGEIESAAKLAEEIGHERHQAKAFAHIVRELARKSVDEARKLCDERVPSEAMLGEANLELMGEVASARAATEDSEQALRIADRALRQRPDEAVEVLARIAYELRLQEVLIGSTAIFSFAVQLACNCPEIPDRLMGLALVAYHAALCGDHNEARHALEKMRDIDREFKGGGEPYHSGVSRTGLVAEVHALLGDVDGATKRMKRIRLLGDQIAAALVCTAIAMSRPR